MTKFAVLPDLDTLFIDFLEAHADLSPLHGGRVGTSLAPGGLTCLRVANLGGSMPAPWLGRPEYQIDSWGGTHAQAERLAWTVCAAIYDMRAAVPKVTWAIVTLTPLWQPDPVSNRPRYITQAQFEATP